jgi:outer membrane protein OmpA-like peptidoglycan-associated protein
MKLKLISVALAFAAAPALAAMGTTDIPTFAGQSAAQQAAKNGIPQTPEEWQARMFDFSRNLAEFKDPKVFVPWAHAVSEPGFYVAMMNGMMDPGGWLNMMNSAAHPDAVRNVAQFVDPNIYLKWAAAGIDPNFYVALMSQLTDPAKLMRWATLPVDAKLWNTLLSTMNPNTYIRWGMSPLDPRAWNLAGTLANPAFYTGMLGATLTPNGTSQNGSNWLSWAPQPSVQGAGSFSMWDPVAMLSNLSGFIPGINLSALPTLPNIGMPTVPTLPSFAPTFVPAPAYGAPAAAPAKVAAAVASTAVIKAPVAAEAPKAVEAPVVAAAPKAVEVPAVVEAPKAVAAPAVVEAPKAIEVPVAVNVPKSVETPVTVAPVVAEAAKPVVEVAASPAPVVVAEPVAAPAEPAAVSTTNKVVLAGDALFVTGKSGIKDLSKGGKIKLDEVVTRIKSMGSIEQIRVIGHADPTGNHKTNLALSQARAKSVKSYLIAKGIKPGVILTSGMGDTQPVVQCDDKLPRAELRACHAPNRRVELEIIGKAK